MSGGCAPWESILAKCISVTNAGVFTAKALACIQLSYGTTDDIDTTFKSVEIGADAAEKAIAIPGGFLLSHFQIKFTDMSTPAVPTVVTSRLTWDEDGDFYIGNQDDDQILLAMATANEGGCLINYGAPGVPLTRPEGQGAAGKLWLWLQLDVGTADVEVWAYFRPADACA